MDKQCAQSHGGEQQSSRARSAEERATFEQMLEATGMAAMYGVTPRDVVAVLMHGTRGPEARLRRSEPMAAVIDECAGNARMAAYMIIFRAILLGLAQASRGQS